VGLFSQKAMAKKTFFTPGPAELYPTFMIHTVKAIGLQIPSISHRSKEFTAIYENVYQKLQTLLNIPDDFAIFFTSSATEIWERLLMNCVEKESFHLVNGAFSERFFNFSKELGKNAQLFQVDKGLGFNTEEVKKQISPTTELLALTHNETSTGVAMPIEEIHSLAKLYQDKIITVDMVSSAPYPNLDYSLIDSAYFSVQKAFGLPAGLGVWIVNKKCLEKSKALKDKGLAIGTYHNLPNLWKYFDKFQTPATPNVLGIYLLGKIIDDMLQKGIEAIRIETEEKAKKLYETVEKLDWLELAVKNPDHRSPTVIVANTKIEASRVLEELAKDNFIIGKGYKSNQETQIRIANFPAISMQKTEKLIDALGKIAF